MTENMKTAIKAINKWVFFGWNYTCVDHIWTDCNGHAHHEVVPQFLVDIHWSCNFDHMLSKWHLAVKDGNTDAYLVKFYAELGIENRILLLEWVMEHYNDERVIVSEDETGKRSEAQILSEIREWAEDYPSYLCNREGYARGYREAMMRAHKIVESMITGEPFEE